MQSIDDEAMLIAQVIWPLRAELECANVKTRSMDDGYDLYSVYRKMHVRRDKTQGVLSIALLDDGLMNLVLNEEDATRFWMHTEDGMIEALREGASHLRVCLPLTPHPLQAARGIARAYFRHEFFERELCHRLPNGCEASIELTAPRLAHVAVMRCEACLFEFDVGPSDAFGLAVTHLTVSCQTHHASLTQASRLLADHAHGWMVDADGLEIEGIPLPTLRIALWVAVQIAQLACVGVASNDETSI